MSEIALRRIPSQIIACFDVSQWERGDLSRGLRDKSADVRRADMAGGVGEVEPSLQIACWRFLRNANEISRPSASTPFCARFPLNARPPPMPLNGGSDRSPLSHS